MEIHKPHAAKTWKEFFIELGTVVIGILIALALEQAVEAAHERARAAQARENIGAEIAYNTGLFATRATVENCVSRRLDEVDGLIQAAMTGEPLPGSIWIGHPPYWPMLSSQYAAASQSGVVSLLPTSEQAAYANIYAGFAEYTEAEKSEQAAWSDLRALENHPIAGPILDWQLRSALKKARAARWLTEVSGQAVQTAAASLGIKPNVTYHFTQQSVCIPLNTPRAEAEKLVAKGRNGGTGYDEP